MPFSLQENSILCSFGQFDSKIPVEMQRAQKAAGKDLKKKNKIGGLMLVDNKNVYQAKVITRG